MPSNGLFPFLRGFLCELNNSCYSLPQDNESGNNSLYELTQLATNIFEFTNRKEVISSATTLVTLFRDVVAIRTKSGRITENLTLSQFLYTSVDSFRNQLKVIINNSTLVNALLDSNPYYNNLYSNYSRKISPLNSQFESILSARLNNTQQLIDFLYGPDLDVSYF